jgi:ADP-heptose:LPS heptosyltransferase
MPVSKPKLLVIELWGLGDLAIATPFLLAASEKFDVTLLAKPVAQDLGARFFPSVRVYPFVAPWTAFQRKYQLLSWPWKKLFRLNTLAAESFDVGASGRWDPRDHILLHLLGCGVRMGFPRRGSQIFLTDALAPPQRYAHRYENWRSLGRALGLALPTREQVGRFTVNSGDWVVVHSGAGQPVRVWPLDRYRNLVARLRLLNYKVRIACDPDQQDWWRSAGEPEVAGPKSVAQLALLFENARAFIGNDSGPGHVAALSGVPTFTLFGPQLPEWFAPLHPAAQYLEGSPCPYKPCFDYCRFPSPNCIQDLDQDTVFTRVQQFLAQLPQFSEAHSIEPRINAEEH